MRKLVNQLYKTKSLLVINDEKYFCFADDNCKKFIQLLGDSLLQIIGNFISLFIVLLGTLLRLF